MTAAATEGSRGSGPAPDRGPRPAARPDGGGAAGVADAATGGGAVATAAREAPPRPRLGLVVNPVAGVGGSVGLKGSDGPDVVRRALALGAVPHARDRAAACLERLAAAWPRGRPLPMVLAAPGPMGADSARDAGIEPAVVGALGASATTAADTRRIVAEIAAAGVDLLLFAGGDGTARDVADALPTAVPALGVPAGVKMHSAVHATSPAAAGALAAAFLALDPARRRTAPREVLDLDEDAYRRGEVAPRLHGELRVPVEGRRLQARKEPTPASEAAATAAIAAEVAASLVPGRRYVLGPGSTVRAIADRLGVSKTLVGVDVAEVGADGIVRTVATDVGARDLEAIVAAAPTVLVVTPIGGQWFILGRGNQQLDPAVVRATADRLGGEGLLVVATPAKLASLRGRPLLVDSGDPALDAGLAGYIAVTTGRGERTIYPVEPA